VGEWVTLVDATCFVINLGAEIEIYNPMAFDLIPSVVSLLFLHIASENGI